MAWDGSGNYTRTNGTNTGTTVWADDAAAAVEITTSRHDTHDQDIATAIDACLTQNNESKPTADFAPNVTATYDLGTTSLKWQDAHINGRAYFYTDSDANLSGVSGTLVIGSDGTTPHIAIDENEIMSKSDATTASALGINSDGGSVTFGVNTDLTSITIAATSISGSAILDEDNMVSNSATKLATQQSIKAYTDGKISSGFITGGAVSSGALPTGWSIASTSSNVTTIQMGASDSLSVSHAVSVMPQDVSGGTSSGVKQTYINQSTADIAADQFDIVCLDGTGSAAGSSRFSFLIIEM